MTQEDVHMLSRIARSTFALVLVAAPVAVAQDQPNLPDEASKLSYAFGQQFGESLKGAGVSKDGIKVDVLVQGLNDFLEGKTTMPAAERQTLIREGLTKGRDALAKANTEASAKFLEENAKKEGFKTTASGLQYKVVTEGTGAKPVASDTVKVHYTGTLTDGTKFDSSVDRGEPAEFGLSQVIPGWTEGLQLMTVGSKYQLVIPAELAYGENSRAPIPPNSVLLFDVELLEIVKGGAAQPEAIQLDPSK